MAAPSLQYATAISNDAAISKSLLHYAPSIES